jgi:ABC-2 type transport system permease protein
MTIKTSDQNAVAVARTTATGRPGVPFGRQLRAEFRKLTDTRASKWLLIAIFAATPLVVAGMLFIADPENLTYSKFVDFTQTPQKLLLPVVAILTVSSEWSQRTGLLTFTLEPNRRRVLLAKGCATLVLGVLVTAVCFASAAVGNLIGIAARHGDGSWVFGPADYRDITLVLVSVLLQGFAYGMLLLITAAAIVAFNVLPNLSSLLFTSVPGLKNVAPWVDLNLAQGALYHHHMTGEQWLQLLTASTIWIILPAILGALRVLRSEVKSS